MNSRFQPLFVRDQRTDTANPVAARQARLNRASSARWESFEPHRRRVMELILAARRSGPSRLCVLGAGNCNDLDLQALAQEFREVRLVDLDGHAIEAACKRQHVAGAATLIRQGGTDLGGIAERLTAVGRTAATQREMQELLDLAANPPKVDLGGPFGIVVSTCLLTQLMNAAVDALGDRHPKLPELLAAIRTSHIRLLARSVRAGGAGVLVTDVASSDSCRRIATTTDSDLAGLEKSIAANGQYFLGVEPASIEEQFKTDVYLSSRIGTITRTRPWQWQITRRRTYLVVGFLFTVRQQQADPIHPHREREVQSGGVRDRSR